MALVIPKKGAGGTTTLKLWDALQAQSPLDSKTDYFDDSSLSGDWTEFDDVSKLTVTEDGDGLKMVLTSGGSSDLTGILKAAPTHTTYTITAEVRWAGGIFEYHTDAGIIISTGLASGANTILVCAGETNTTRSKLDWARWSARTTFGAIVASNHGMLPAPSRLFLRFYVDTSAATIQPLWSGDGRSWAAMADPVAYSTLGFGAGTADYIGLVINNDSASENVTIRSSMFRVDNTSDPYHAVGAFPVV